MEITINCLNCGRRIGTFRVSRHVPDQTIEIPACQHGMEAKALWDKELMDDLTGLTPANVKNCG